LPDAVIASVRMSVEARGETLRLSRRALLIVGESGVIPRYERVLDFLETDHRFGSSEPFAIGVEEELFLVDPLTGRLANTSAVVLERVSVLRLKFV
jgi:hypothetical protein